MRREEIELWTCGHGVLAKRVLRREIVAHDGVQADGRLLLHVAVRHSGDVLRGLLRRSRRLRRGGLPRRGPIHSERQLTRGGRGWGSRGGGGVRLVDDGRHAVSHGSPHDVGNGRGGGPRDGPRSEAGFALERPRRVRQAVTAQVLVHQLQQLLLGEPDFGLRDDGGPVKHLEGEVVVARETRFGLGTANQLQQLVRVVLEFDVLAAFVLEDGFPGR